MKEKFKDLEDYGIIGNLETCALVGSDGSVDWLCLPYLESPSVFAALLDNERGGRFRIRPTGKYRVVQEYSGDTNVLETTFHTSLGVISITDFMPVKTIEDYTFVTTLFRKLEWIEKGEEALELDFEPRFDYARELPEFQIVEGGVVAKGKHQSLFLHSPLALEIRKGGAHGIIRAGAGSTLWFVLRYNDRAMPGTGDCENFLDRTLNFWQGWAHTCSEPECLFAGPWHNLVVRSGLVLKLLTNADNGAIAAAATTSLPEIIGGVRNWDYRFSWIRDAAFTVQALYQIGHGKESAHFRRWIRGIVDKTHNVAQLKILYPLRGERDCAEHILDSLSGYKDSSPVRVGNGAAGQEQMDIYGELLNALYETARYGEDLRNTNWPMIREIVEYVCRTWKKPDSGIWEARSAPADYTYSKLMCWVAVDRGIKVAKLKGFDAPLATWASVERDIRSAVLKKGFSTRLNSFVRTFGSEDLDATGLLVPVTGFLPFEDDRVQGTIDAVMKYLMMSNGMIARYHAEDGLPGAEGSFVLCSFWLVRALSLSGRSEEAEKLFVKVLDYMSPLGLIAEEIDPQTGKLLGNMPQAFSHTGLINAALHIGIAKGKKHTGPLPIGEEHRAKEHSFLDT